MTGHAQAFSPALSRCSGVFGGKKATVLAVRIWSRLDEGHLCLNPKSLKSDVSECVRLTIVGHEQVRRHAPVPDGGLQVGP